MRTWKIIFLVIVILVILFFMIFRLGGEDSWIKDERGVYIKHGSPASVPDYVKEQQEIINCALNLYEKNKEEGIEFNSQCLGICENYAVDIVHVPRNEEDNKVENQCQDYREGKVTKFIELDKDGEIVRIL